MNYLFVLLYFNACCSQHAYWSVSPCIVSICDWFMARSSNYSRKVPMNRIFSFSRVLLWHCFLHTWYCSRNVIVVADTTCLHLFNDIRLMQGHWKNRIYLLFYLFFRRSSHPTFSCRPFVANTTFSTGLVGVEVSSVSWLVANKQNFENQQLQ